MSSFSLSQCLSTPNSAPPFLFSFAAHGINRCHGCSNPNCWKDGHFEYISAAEEKEQKEYEDSQKLSDENVGQLPCDLKKLPISEEKKPAVAGFLPLEFVVDNVYDDTWCDTEIFISRMTWKGHEMHNARIPIGKQEIDRSSFDLAGSTYEIVFCGKRTEKYHANELLGSNGEKTNTGGHSWWADESADRSLRFLPIGKKKNADTSHEFGDDAGGSYGFEFSFPHQNYNHWKDSSNFKLHGNYCGPGHTGGPTYGNANFNAQPIDKLDEGCRAHDYAYFKGDNIGAADLALSQAAFSSMDETPFLGFATGVGMLAKYAVDQFGPAGPSFGGQNSTPTTAMDALQFPDIRSTFRMKDTAEVLRGADHNDTSSGSHGEFTEGDGVKGGRKGLKKSEKKLAKKLSSKFGKKTASNFKRQIRSAGMKGTKRGQSGGIRSNVMPTQYQTTSTVVPYYKTVKATGSGKTVDTLVSLGQVNLTGCKNDGTNFLVGNVIYSIPLDKTAFSGQTICDDFDNFEMYRIEAEDFAFIPSVGSTTAGSIWFTSDPDATDVLAIGQTVSTQFIVSHENPVKHTLWQGACRGPINVNRKWLYTDAAFVTANSNGVNSSGGETRLFTAGVFNVICGENLVDSLTSVGELFFRVKVSFKDTQHADTSKLICSFKGWHSTTIQTVGSGSFNPFLSLINTANVAPLMQTNFEYCYNPRNFNYLAGTFNLPVGTYLFTTWMSCQSTTTVTAAPTYSGSVTNATYSMLDVGMNLAADTNSPEFSFTAAGGHSLTGAIPLVSTSVLRITEATTLLASHANNYTNNVNAGGIVYAYHLQCMRIPEFMNLPTAMFFPIGNNTTVVMLDEKKIHQQRLLSAKKALQTIYEHEKFVDEEKKWKNDVLHDLSEDEEAIDRALEKEYAESKKICASVPESECLLTDSQKKYLLKNPHWTFSDARCLDWKAVDGKLTCVDTDTAAIKNAQRVLDVAQQAKEFIPCPTLDPRYTTGEEPDSPAELVENPLSKSVHLSSSAATSLLSLLSGKK